MQAENFKLRHYRLDGVAFLNRGVAIFLAVLVGEILAAIGLVHVGAAARAAADAALLLLGRLEDQSTTVLNLESSPITQIAFIDDSSFVGIAFDRHVYLFQKVEGKVWYC